MGHERLGALPRTRRWRHIVEQIASARATESSVAALADRTLQNVRSRFERLADEDATRAAISFLVAVPRSAEARDPRQALQGHGFTLDDDPSPRGLARAFSQAVMSRSPSEATDLTAKSVADALTQFSRTERFLQPNLFASSRWEPWRHADNAAAFCELSRLFLANLTERYLRYFLDREASAVLGDPEARDSFRESIRTTVHTISEHAFETSKIAQSFAAGWFNKHARESMPTRPDVHAFLVYALHKVREELRREATP